MMQRHIPEECRALLPSVGCNRILANLNNMNCATTNGRGLHRTTVPHLEENTTKGSNTLWKHNHNNLFPPKKKNNYKQEHT
jgi:hypothetical protein